MRVTGAPRGGVESLAAQHGLLTQARLALRDGQLKLAEALCERLCGLDWNDACLRPEQNVRTVATPSLWQARQPVYRSSVARWRRYEPWLVHRFRETHHMGRIPIFRRGF